MKRMKKNGLASVVLALVLCIPLAASATKVPAPDGPFKVGVRIMHARIDGRNAPFLVWYPAQKTGGKPYPYSTNIPLQAYLDAAPDRSQAPYPLVLFSHGMGGCAAQHVFINENLASHGYVVVAPDYREAAMCHIEGGQEISGMRLTWLVLKDNFDLSGVVMDMFGDYMKDINYDFTYRGREAIDSINRALEWNKDEKSFLNGMIDPNRIGMSGHSLGGYTTLLVGGLPDYCGKEPPPANQCSFENIGLRNIPNPCCLEYLRGKDPFQYRDKRVKAMFVMSAAVMFPELPRAAASLQIPIMIVNGDDKKFEVPLEPLQTIYDNAPPPKYLIILKDTDHMTAADSTIKVSVSRFVLPGFRSNFYKKAQAYNAYCVAFFNKYLKGQGSSDALSGPVNDFVKSWSKKD
jgi:predicted dienelactone hydrolase